MRKLLILFLSTCIFILFEIAPTFGAPLAGKYCAKAGLTQISQGKKYICIKSGPRLVWSKGSTLPIKTAALPPTNLPKFAPWSNPINQNQELVAFHKAMDDWFSTARQRQVDLNIYIDPQVSQNGIKWISDALMFQAQLTGMPTPAKYKIFIGKSDGYIINKRKSLDIGLENWNPQYICYEDSNQGCADPINQESFFVWNASSLLTPTEDWQFTRSLGHEFFHITQCDLIGDVYKCGYYFNQLPSWLAEGGPNVIGAIFADRIGNLKYEDQRKFSLSIYQNGKNGANTPLSEFTKNIRFGELFPYEIGMLACEYLISSTSLQTFFDFYSNLPKSVSFEDAFQKSFGINVSEFYAAFDNARVNLGFFPVKK
jgi:hypothetical protein